MGTRWEGEYMSLFLNGLHPDVHLENPTKLIKPITTYNPLFFYLYPG
jgi:hypothetical protein